MTSMMRRFGLAAVVVVLLAGATGQAEAGLMIGSPVNGSLTFGPSSNEFSPATATIQDPGVEFTYTPLFEAFLIADLAADTLTLNTSITKTGILVAPAGTYEFTGLQVAGGGGITGLSQVAGATLPVTSFSFTASSIRVEVGSYTVGAPGSLSATFAIQTAVAAVPEPSTLISGGIACLFGLGYGWRRRKAKLAA